MSYVIQSGRSQQVYIALAVGSYIFDLILIQPAQGSIIAETSVCLTHESALRHSSPETATVTEYFADLRNRHFVYPRKRLFPAPVVNAIVTIGSTQYDLIPLKVMLLTLLVACIF